jgi:hypothetical protein
VSGGWEWVAFAYATSAVVLGGYTWLLAARRAAAARRRRELG